MSNCNCNQGRLPCTCKIDAVEDKLAAGLTGAVKLSNSGLTQIALLGVTVPTIKPSDFGASKPQINAEGYINFQSELAFDPGCKDEECHMTKYKCNCDASAGAPDHARTCPEHRDFGKISGSSQPKMANSPQLDLYAAGAAACEAGTSPQSPGRSYHPLVNIAEWRKGCSCAPKDFPVRCEECTEGLIRAVENWFTQHRGSRILGVAGVLEDLDARGSLPETVDGRAAEIIRHLESELYAADDQVEGLQELMRAHVTEKHLREYARQDIKVVETVSREVELHAALVKAQKVIDMLFPGVSKIFGVDFQELNECCMAVSQALKAKPTAEPVLPRFHAGKVDLIVELQAMRQEDGHPKDALKKLGIIWENYWGQPLADQVHLHGRTNVPVVLPDWLRLKVKR